MVAPAACPVTKAGGAGPIVAVKGAICGLPNAAKAAAVVAAGGLLAFLLYKYASGCGGASCTTSTSESPSETKVKTSNPATKRKKRRSASSKKISRKAQVSDPDLPNLASESPVADRPPSAYLDLNAAAAAPSSGANNNSVMVDGAAATDSVSLAPK